MGAAITPRNIAVTVICSRRLIVPPAVRQAMRVYTETLSRPISPTLAVRNGRSFRAMSAPRRTLLFDLEIGRTPPFDRTATSAILLWFLRSWRNWQTHQLE